MFAKDRRVVGRDQQLPLNEVAVGEHITGINNCARNENRAARILTEGGNREREQDEYRHAAKDRSPDVAQAHHQRISFVMTLYISSAAEMTFEFIS